MSHEVWPNYGNFPWFRGIVISPFLIANLNDWTNLIWLWDIFKKRMSITICIATQLFPSKSFGSEHQECSFHGQLRSGVIICVHNNFNWCKNILFDLYKRLAASGAGLVANTIWFSWRSVIATVSIGGWWKSKWLWAEGADLVFIQGRCPHSKVGWALSWSAGRNNLNHWHLNPSQFKHIEWLLRNLRTLLMILDQRSRTDIKQYRRGQPFNLPAHPFNLSQIGL